MKVNKEKHSFFSSGVGLDKKKLLLTLATVI